MANMCYRFDGVDLGLPLIFSGGFHNYLHTISLPPHAHTQGVEITYVMKGDTCWLLDDGTELFLSGGSLAAVQPDVRHHGQGNIIRPCWLFWFILNLESPDCLLNTPFLPPDAAELQAVFRNAGNCVRRAPEHYDFYAEQLIRQLPQSGTTDFLQLAALRNTLCQMVMAAAGVFRSSSGTPQPDSTVAGNAEKIMRLNLGKELTMTAIAEKLGLSATSFIKRFKQETGLTPADFFQRIKVEDARRRLAGSGASITAIAFELGFASSQHFASVFKQYTGMTPREFRLKSVKQEPSGLSN